MSEDELQRYRSMLVHSAKLAELGQQLAGLVHEMNQPLLGIKAFAQMLKADLVQDARTQRKAAFIEEQAIVLERLVERVRRFGRQAEIDENATTVMRDAVETALTILGHRFKRGGVSCAVSGDELLPPARIGDVHAQQLMVNLLANAADAVEQQPERRIIVALAQVGERLRVVVADSGSGIDPGLRDQVFEPFFTTKAQDRGTGLGLAICKEIVEAYGGRIVLSSDADAETLAGPGMRTAFQVELPIGA